MERVLPDIRFSEKLLARLTAFYVKHIIPEFIPEHPLEDTTTVNSPPSVDLPPSNESLLKCFCQKEESGKVIICEGSHCLVSL